MLKTYTSFITKINEGSDSSPTIIYWDHQLVDVLDKEWTNITVKILTHSSNIYTIGFKAGNEKYDYYGVLFDSSSNSLLVQDTHNVDSKFQKKLNIEFWKNAVEYSKNMDFDPKFLGDVSHIRDAERYNM